MPNQRPDPSVPIIKDWQKSLRCKGCGLIFFPAEVMLGLYDRAKTLCIRCYVKTRAVRYEKTLPECFGYGYQDTQPECTERCKIHLACMLEKADRAVISTINTSKSVTRRTKYGAGILAILRVIARPIHVHDLIPILEKEFGMKIHVQDNRGVQKIVQMLQCNNNIIWLGDGFMVWSGAWRPEYGGWAKKISAEVVVAFEEDIGPKPEPKLEQELDISRKW